MKMIMLLSPTSYCVATRSPEMAVVGIQTHNLIKFTAIHVIMKKMVLQTKPLLEVLKAAEKSLEAWKRFFNIFLSPQEGLSRNFALFAAASISRQHDCVYICI